LLGDAEQQALLQLAARSIREGLATGRPYHPLLDQYPATLRERGASFVTLERGGQLRGCIGMLEAVRPLAEDVAENAYAAAFRDPRFPPLREEEYRDLDLHLSILGPATELQFASEAELLGQMVPFVDGMTLQEGHYRGTFLPSVWDSLPRPEAFLSHLKQKAGLPGHYWSDTLRVWRYHTQSFGTALRDLKT